MGMAIPGIHLVQEGPERGKPWQNARLTQRDLCKRHVVISWPHTKGSVIMLGRHGNMTVL
jgi:hypothetical protein